jgi:hypothetical protein
MLKTMRRAAIHAVVVLLLAFSLSHKTLAEAVALSGVLNASPRHPS